MTRTSVLSLRPVLAFGIVLAAVSMLFLATEQNAEAGAANSLSVNPALREVAPGSATSIQLISEAPTESLAAWVVEIAFDETVVSAGTCTSINPPAGSVAATDCGSKDTGGGPDDDTLVSVGAILFPSTERGIDGTNTLATFNLNVIGDIGECTDMTITVIDHLGPDANAPGTNPTLAHGEICIVEDPGVDRLWGDFDCSDSVDPIDSLKLLRFDAGLSVAQADGCPAPNAAVTVDGEAQTWGDLDCDGNTNPVDSLKTLRFNAGLSVAQTQPCPVAGAEVSVS